MPLNDAGEERVALAPDGVVGIGLRRVVVAQESGVFRVGLGRGGGEPLELGVELRVALVTGDQCDEERRVVGFVAAPRAAACSRAAQGLSPRRHDAARDPFAQRGLVAGECFGDACEALRRRSPSRARSRRP